MHYSFRPAIQNKQGFPSWKGPSNPARQKWRLHAKGENEGKKLDFDVGALVTSLLSRLKQAETTWDNHHANFKTAEPTGLLSDVA